MKNIFLFLSLCFSFFSQTSVAQIIYLDPEHISSTVPINSVSTIPVEVENAGTANLEFTFNRTSSTPSWVTFNTSQQNLSPGNTVDIDITIDSDDENVTMDQGYSWYINITHNAPTQNSPIEYYCYVDVRHPVSYGMDQYRFYLNEDDDPVSTTLSLHNGSDGSINYTLSVSESWLSVSPTSGILYSEETDDITVTVDPDDELVGNHNGYITLSSTEYPYNNLYIPIELIIEGPGHTISPTSYNVYGYENGGGIARDLRINNISTGSITYSISESVDWLVIEPTSGTIQADDTETVTVSFEPRNHPMGSELSTTITVTTSDPGYSPDYIGAHFTIIDQYADPPSIAYGGSTTINETLYAFDDQSHSINANVTNEGGQFLYFRFSNDQDWLNAGFHGDLFSGQSIMTRGHRIMPADLTIGNYTGYIYIDHNDPSQGVIEIEVNLTTEYRTCDYVPGDINGNGSVNGLDVMYGTNYFKGGDPPPDVCYNDSTNSNLYSAGDCNGNCVFNGFDVTYLSNYFKGGPAPTYCPQTPPEE